MREDRKGKANHMDDTLHGIYQAILNGSSSEVIAWVEKALKAGLSPKMILDQGMASAMAEAGRLFEMNEFYVPELLVTAHAMQTGLGLLKPHLVEARVKPMGRIAIGTVTGDLHDIGKNLVGMMLEGAGFEILDLGVNVPPEKFLEVVDSVDAIALSALLTTTMPAMRSVIDALNDSEKRDHVKVFVGGAPVTEAFAKSIGADGYAPDASQAVNMIKACMP